MGQLNPTPSEGDTAHQHTTAPNGGADNKEPAVPPPLPRSWPGTAGWSQGNGTTPRAADRDVHRPQQQSRSSSSAWQRTIPPGGIDPAPRRSGPTWRQFLTTQSKAVLAADFRHVDTVFLTRIYALITVEHHTRRAYLAGVTAQPTGAWTTP